MDQSGGYEELPFVAEFYDHVVPYRERPDVEFYVEMASESGGPVLELACGTGRILVPTARAGVSITGLDLSERMLAICREKLACEPSDVQARVQLIQGDIRRFDLGRRFRLATIPFRPFQHLLTVDDQLACLGSTYRHLEPGGRLVFDVFNPDMRRIVTEALGEEMAEEPPFDMPDGRRVVRTHRRDAVDLPGQILHGALIYHITHPDGRQERLVQSFPLRYLFRYEVEHLLARAGFEVEALYSDFDKSLYGAVYPGELIVVARRAA